MFEEDKRDNDALGDLKKRLYTRGDMGRRTLRKGRLFGREGEVKSDWGEGPIVPEKYEPVLQDKPSSPFKKFFLGSLIFFLLAFSYAAYQFFGGGNIVSARNINISVIGPAFASGGDEISLQVSVDNKNSVPLEYAEMLMEYPRGSVSPNSSSTPDMVRNRINMEKIPSGGTAQQIVKATLYGEEGMDQTIKFTLEYRISGSNATFQKEYVYPVKISSAPISLTLDSPSKINAGQDLTLKVKISSNAPKNVPGVLLSVNYPPGFFFKDASPKPAYGNNVWNLGDFSPGSERQVDITGYLTGQDGEERTFQILGGSPSQDDERTVGVIYNSIFQKVSISHPFLDANLAVNGVTGDSVLIQGGRQVRADILWKNNLPMRINDGSIVVKISGNAIDRSSVSSDYGFYNSSAGTITWDKNTSDELGIIEPGATGRLPFVFSTMPVSSAGNSISNPEADFQITVRGSINTESGSGPTSVTTDKRVKISSDLQLLSRALYSSGPISNIGPMPPVAEKETTYSIYWGITNSSNDLDGVAVSTTLPPYVSWAGQVSPQNENISYDDSTRIVLWRPGSVPAGTGYGSSPREIYFKIKLKPSISQVGNAPSLTGGITIFGKDSFSGSSLSLDKNPLDTRISGDPSFKQGNEVVQMPGK